MLNMSKYIVQDKIITEPEIYIEYFDENIKNIDKNLVGKSVKYKQSVNLNEQQSLENLIAKKVKISDVVSNRILLKFKGIIFSCLEQINNSSKSLIISDFVYVDQDKLSEYSINEIENKIIIIDCLTKEMLYMSKALRAVAIFTNSIDYSIYSRINEETMPIQIFSGFGKIPFDQQIKQLLVDHQKQIVLDYNYKRMVLSKHNLENKIEFKINF